MWMQAVSGTAIHPPRRSRITRAWDRVLSINDILHPFSHRMSIRCFLDGMTGQEDTPSWTVTTYYDKWYGGIFIYPFTYHLYFYLQGDSFPHIVYFSQRCPARGASILEFWQIGQVFNNCTFILLNIYATIFDKLQKGRVSACKRQKPPMQPLKTRSWAKP